MSVSLRVETIIYTALSTSLLCRHHVHVQSVPPSRARRPYLRGRELPREPGPFGASRDTPDATANPFVDFSKHTLLQASHRTYIDCLLWLPILEKWFMMWIIWMILDEKLFASGDQIVGVRTWFSFCFGHVIYIWPLFLFSMHGWENISLSWQ